MFLFWPHLKVFDDSTWHSARGRQKKRREDNIKEWTGLDLAQLGQLKAGQGGDCCQVI